MGGDQPRSDRQKTASSVRAEISKGIIMLYCITLQRVATLAEVPECENEDREIMENGNETGSTGVIEDREKKLTTTRSNTSLTQQSGDTTVENSQGEAVANGNDHREEGEDEPQTQVGNETGHTPSEPQAKENATTSNLQVPSKKVNDSSSGDQLRQLLSTSSTTRSTSPGLITGSSPSDRSRESKSPSPVDQSDEPKRSRADAQVRGGSRGRGRGRGGGGERGREKERGRDRERVGGRGRGGGVVDILLCVLYHTMQISKIFQFETIFSSPCTTTLLP